MKHILFAGIMAALPMVAHAQSAGLMDAYGTCEGTAHIQASGTIVWTGYFARYCPNVVARWKRCTGRGNQEGERGVGGRRAPLRPVTRVRLIPNRHRVAFLTSRL